MANAGSIVASLIVNADQMVAGFNAGTEAAKKASNSIGGSIDRINSKQINQAATSILKNMLGPVALVSAGASMATDLVKGFSTGSIKTWEDAGRGLMESLNKGLQSIPIVGEFAKLGEAIGNAFTGVDKAVASIAETAVQVEKVKVLVESLKGMADLRISNEEKILKDIADLNKTDSEKNLDKYADELDKKLALTEKNALAVWEAQNVKPQQKIMVERKSIGGSGGGQIVKEEIDNPEYDKLMEEREVKRQKYIADRKKDNDQVFNDEMTKLENLTKIYDEAVAKKTADAEQQKQMAKEIGDLIKQIDDEQLKIAKEKIEAEKALTKARQNARDEAIKGYEDFQQAQDDFAATEETLKKQTENETTTTGLSTAIGTVKVAGANDFSVQKQLDVAKETLAESKRQSDYLKSIDANLHPGGKVT